MLQRMQYVELYQKIKNMISTPAVFLQIIKLESKERMLTVLLLPAVSLLPAFCLFFVLT